MTSQPQNPYNSNRVSAGPASDTKAFFAATLLTFLSGMIVLIGFIMAGGFGIVLGIVGMIFGLVWWKGHHGSMLPRDLPAKSVVGLTLGSLLLLGLAALMA